MKLTEILLFCTLMFVGHYAIKYKAKSDHLTNDKIKNDSLLHYNKETLLNQTKMIFKLDSIKSNCVRCRKYPVYELNN